MRIRSAAAVAAGRFGGTLSRALRLGGGTSLPGAIALRVDPRIIAELAGDLDRGSTVVTATNGKTTTANMLAAVYHAAGLEPVHNTAGANLAYGVATALISAVGRQSPSTETPPGAAAGAKPKIGLFEVDEAVVKNVVVDLNPAVLTVGNIFRDQLDRFGEVDQTARLIGKGIKLLSDNSCLVLNADDPRVASLAQGARQKVIFYGIDDGVDSGNAADAQDSQDCLICGERLSYDRRYFSHLGVYSCAGCGFARPVPTIVASNLNLSLKQSRFRLRAGTKEIDVTLGVPALYNVYNALAAAAAAHAVGMELKYIAAGLESFRATFGRFESIEAGGRRVWLLLIKNPTGFNQAIEALNLDPAPKDVMIAINDNLADGTDVSWLWDADVERLGSTKLLLAAGVRAHDMALRLKYAGYPAPKIVVEPDFDAALGRAWDRPADGASGDLFILATYTAMLDIRKRLEKLGGVAAFWRAPKKTGSPERVEAP